MTWTTLTFGKHFGKTLPQVLFVDPDYFFWAAEAGALREIPVEEAEDLRRKATRIRIRQSGPDLLAVEYTLQPRDGRLANVTFVPRSEPAHLGGSRTLRCDFIDLSLPRRLAPYDKMGCTAMVQVLKEHYFQNRRFRMTRKRCEEFFEDPANFTTA